MKVLIDARPIIGQYAGIGQCVRNIISRLPSLLGDGELSVLAYDQAKTILNEVPGLNVRYLNYKYKTLFTIIMDIMRVPLPDILIGHFDIIHQTYFATLPTTHRDTGIITTINDVAYLTYPEFFVRNNIKLSRICLKRQVECSDRIITISNYTKSELVAKVGADPAKITTIYPGIEVQVRNILPEEIEKTKSVYGIKGKYILFIGTLEPRKNLKRLIAAFSLLKNKTMSLVIIGKKGWHYDDIFAEVQARKLEDSVIFLGYLSAQEKTAVLKGAELFVYPSLYEGFGMPIAEAMSWGIPVIAGNNSSMPEVVGDAGLLVNPIDIDDIARGIKDLLSDSDRRAEYSRKALSRSHYFSWDDAAKKIWQIYHDVYREKHEKRGQH
jgi:glycosyltransferase involved in cell wall biosynthesis